MLHTITKRLEICMDVNTEIQWTLSISTTLYLEQNVRSLEISPKNTAEPFELLYLELFPISNKFSGPLNHFLSLSRTFTNSNFIFEFLNKFEFE